jgi:nucleoside 2-deoxyribosyltransferase
MIYLASPYSHPDPDVREQRYRAACRAAAELIQAGHIVFSPVIHSHPLTEFGLPTGWEFWQRLDLALLERCDELVVLKLEGWEESVGVQAEIRTALELRKPVLHWDPPMLVSVEKQAR